MNWCCPSTDSQTSINDKICCPCWQDIGKRHDYPNVSCFFFKKIVKDKLCILFWTDSNINSGYKLAEVHRPARENLIEKVVGGNPRLWHGRIAEGNVQCFCWKQDHIHCQSRTQHGKWQDSAVSKCLRLRGWMCACMLSRFSHARLCDAMDCSPPGSSVHGIL